VSLTQTAANLPQLSMYVCVCVKVCVCGCVRVSTHSTPGI